jgi:hypothetical protein
VRFNQLSKTLSSKTRCSAVSGAQWHTCDRACFV